MAPRTAPPRVCLVLQHFYPMPDIRNDEPTSPNRPRRLREWRHLVLLVSILGLFIITPVVAIFPHAVVLLNAFATFVLAAGSYALFGQRRLFAIALAWSGVSISATVLLLLTQRQWAAVLSHCCVIILIAFFCITILGYVLGEGRISLDKIFAAVCVYMLIGYAWTFAYALIGQVQPDAFLTTAGQPAQPVAYVPHILAMRYFSFMTLTTVGYGDIVPYSAAARTLAALEAITGQIYLTVLVARLVGLHIVHAAGSRSSKS